jgi:hypothetical protein
MKDKEVQELLKLLEYMKNTLVDIELEIQESNRILKLILDRGNRDV